ncbi:hypothetical protein RUM44_006043 [Polyplax serrata]|uniref:Uncharacterized protein n=1 Tax=Polyplax serrata TaxID=468196 RepID=A0ABR1AYS2_POLSC
MFSTKRKQSDDWGEQRSDRLSELKSISKINENIKSDHQHHNCHNQEDFGQSSNQFRNSGKARRKERSSHYCNKRIPCGLKKGGTQDDPQGTILRVFIVCTGNFVQG